MRCITRLCHDGVSFDDTTACPVVMSIHKTKNKTVRIAKHSIWEHMHDCTSITHTSKAEIMVDPCFQM